MDNVFTNGSNQGDGCDESLCISTGSSESHGSSSFTCYGEEENGSGMDGIVYPMMCADGYLPKVVEGEPPATNNVHLLRYFTCCPPDYNQTNESAVTRHCSDPIDAETDDDGKIIDPTVCELHDIRKYPRPMKTRGSYDSYGFVLSTLNSFVCCDSKFDAVGVGDGDGDIENENENQNENENATPTTYFLNDLECVPFCDKFYKECKIDNRVGATWLNEIQCNLPEEDFRFARPIEGGDDILSTRRYQCCKTGPALPLYLHNSSFQIEVYTLLTMFIVAAIASAVVAIGLLVPLLIQLKNGKFQRTSLQVRRGETRFSSYNLYLVYLASPDFLYSIFSIWRLQCIINQNNPVTFSLFYAIPYGWAGANIWINSIMCYEVLLLLKSRERVQRLEPPSLTRVTFQSIAAYFLSAILCVSFYFLYEALEEAINNDDTKTSETINLAISCFQFLGILSPIGYVTYVYIVVWYRGYIPPMNGTTPNERAMRELSRYFLRIVGVFFGIWFPSAFIVLSAGASGLAWPAFLSAILTAFQPIGTSYVIAIKSDTRKYIFDLLTLSYLFGDKRIRGVRGIKKTIMKLRSQSYGGNASTTEPSYDTEV